MQCSLVWVALRSRTISCCSSMTAENTKCGGVLHEWPQKKRYASPVRRRQTFNETAKRDRRLGTQVPKYPPLSRTRRIAFPLASSTAAEEIAIAGAEADPLGNLVHRKSNRLS